MSKVYRTWRDFPLGDWRWASFSPQEMASKGEGELLVHEPSMDMLQELRNRLGKPLLITSAYRSEAHNRRVGGATQSQHRLGRAFDVRMDNHDPAAFEKAAKAVGFTGFGHYPKSGFMHIDTGPARRWNDGSWFAAKPVATPTFPVEPKVDTIKDIVTKPEVLTAGGAVLSGGAAVASGSGPVQWALAVLIVLIAAGAGVWLIMRVLRRPSDV
jgi:zinc D-Ala-D-Ala carboxypeptidase